MNSLQLRIAVAFALTVLGPGESTSKIAAQNIELELRDRDSGAKVPMRFRFLKGEKQAGLPRNLPKVGKWTLLEDNVPITPKPGEYEFLAHRGHEFTDIRGGFTIEKGARDFVTIETPRSTSMRNEGWYSGDHASTLPDKVLERWQAAEALDMAIAFRDGDFDDANPNSTAPSKPNRNKKRTNDEEEEPAGEKELGAKLLTRSYRFRFTGGSLLLHPNGNANPIAIPEQTDLPQVMEILANDESVNGYIPELEQLWTRDVPILLSSNRIKAAQILNSANAPDGDAKLEFDSKSSVPSRGRLLSKSIKKGQGDKVFVPIKEDDFIRYRDGRGIGLLSEQVLWNILETGIRTTPTSSSGFGDGDTHLGYNRTYIHTDESVNQDLYWNSVGLGKTIVTNGPLLRVTVNDQFPGHTFISSDGEPIELNIAASLSVRDPVDYLDVIFNGETLYSAKLEDHYRKGEFPPIAIEKSGWLVIRVVTTHDHLYRFSTTAPFYFEFDGQSRISAKSVNFMLEWLKHSSDSLLQENPANSKLKSTIDAAEKFWQARLEQSNAP